MLLNYVLDFVLMCILLFWILGLDSFFKNRQYRPLPRFRPAPSSTHRPLP